MTETRSRAAALLLAVVVAVGAAPASAHKIKVFAVADGAGVSGYAYLPGGRRIADAVVTIEAPDGRRLATLRTDAEGAFRHPVTERVDHRVVLDLGDGHRAEYTIPADRLPEPAGGGEAPAPVLAAGTATASPPAAVPATDEAALARLVEEAVARQILPLREDVDAWRAEVRAGDAIGGLGLIAGLAGLAFFWLGRRERRR